MTVVPLCSNPKYILKPIASLCDTYENDGEMFVSARLMQAKEGEDDASNIKVISKKDAEEDADDDADANLSESMIFDGEMFVSSRLMHAKEGEDDTADIEDEFKFISKEDDFSGLGSGSA